MKKKQKSNFKKLFSKKLIIPNMVHHVHNDCLMSLCHFLDNMIVLDDVLEVVPNNNWYHHGLHASDLLAL